MAKASKTMVIGMAERNGRIHLESMSNRRFESIKPVLDAKLAENTTEVVTDGNPSYKGLIPREKHSRGNHSKELDGGVGVSQLNVWSQMTLNIRGRRDAARTTWKILNTRTQAIVHWTSFSSSIFRISGANPESVTI